MDLLDTRSVQHSLPGLLADNQIHGLKNSNESGQGKKNEKLKSVSRQFESLLTHQLLTAMRSTVPKSGLMDGFSSEMYQSMLDQELANQVSKGKGIGLADMVQRQLVQLEKKADARQLESRGTVVTEEARTGNPGFALKPTDSIDSNKSARAGALTRASNAYRGNR